MDCRDLHSLKTYGRPLPLNQSVNVEQLGDKLMLCKGIERQLQTEIQFDPALQSSVCLNSIFDT